MYLWNQLPNLCGVFTKLKPKQYPNRKCQKKKKIIFSTSDWFCLIVSHILLLCTGWISYLNTYVRTTDIRGRSQNLRYFNPGTGLKMAVFGFSHNQNNRDSSSADQQMQKILRNGYKLAFVTHNRYFTCHEASCKLEEKVDSALRHGTSTLHIFAWLHIQCVKSPSAGLTLKWLTFSNLCSSTSCSHCKSLCSWSITFNLALALWKYTQNNGIQINVTYILHLSISVFFQCEQNFQCDFVSHFHSETWE